jgi:nitrogen regulatory protein PII
MEKEKLENYPKESYTFNFGPKELITMVGVEQAAGKEYINEIFKKNKFSLRNGKIHLEEIDELIKINNYYSKIEEVKRRDRKSRI